MVGHDLQHLTVDRYDFDCELPVFRLVNLVLFALSGFLLDFNSIESIGLDKVKPLNLNLIETHFNCQALTSTRP